MQCFVHQMDKYLFNTYEMNTIIIHCIYFEVSIGYRSYVSMPKRITSFTASAVFTFYRFCDVMEHYPGILTDPAVTEGPLSAFGVAIIISSRPCAS